MAKLRDRPQGYAGSRERFSRSVGKIVALSARMNGTPSGHGRQYWSSILAAKLTLGAMTLDKIIPKIASPASKDLWDLGSVATLVRVLAENYILLHWLCVETEDQDLWLFRFKALSIMDNRSRYRLTQEVEGQPEPEEFVSAQKSMAEHIAVTRNFQALTASQQKEILKGLKTPFIHDDVVERLEIDRDDFRKFYRYLSAFVHTGTVSWIRVEDQGRCNGEFNTYEAGAMQACMEFAGRLIDRAVKDLRAISKTGPLIPTEDEPIPQP
ncbi:DUF5677 domain-containing protein [Caulobacter segnis]|uniref:DUF5677 domain-containing protein n=1 Tax=Caulobacter segnis TaxID=88688 RepID=UPI00285D5E7B|nr:DUF5677 domain-containing protein [Caulobacter segnis]MDR6624507.1 hypothetical protein [Caulobacter segnis]